MDENVDRMIREFGGGVQRLPVDKSPEISSNLRVKSSSAKFKDNKNLTRAEIKKLIKASQGKEKKEKSFLNKALSEKFTKAPSVKAPSYSAEKLVRGLARERRALVREVEVPEVVEDNRSLFFKSEFIRENKKDQKWLLR